jgi:DNA-binding NarL/FixJ family response regulator
MHTSEDITVVLAADSFLVGDGLAAILADVPDVKVVGMVRDFSRLMSSIDEMRPQAVLICVRSQVATTTAVATTARNLRVAYPDMGIVVISDRVNEFTVDLLRGGSTGISYLLEQQLPGIDAVVDALRASRMGASSLDPSIVQALIRRGDASGMGDLTPREVNILEQMAHGMSNRGIANELHISIKSIEKGVTAIFLKLGPFDREFSDRRVSSALVYLRAQVDPFGPSGDYRESVRPLVLLVNVPDPTVADIAIAQPS